MTTLEIIFDTPKKARAFMTWLETYGVDYYLDCMEDDACCSVCEFNFDEKHLRILTRGELNGCSKVKDD